MAWLTDDELLSFGFAHVGQNVKISTKASIYTPDRISIGDRSRIDDFCVVSGKVTIGKNVHIAVFCNIAGGDPGVVLEDFSGLAYGCHVFSQSDDYTGEGMTNPTVSAEFTRVFKAQVVIGRHAIIGTASLIFPGVVVAEGCSVGANATVSRSTEPWGIYAGTPARRVRDRKKDLLALEQQYLVSLNS